MAKSRKGRGSRKRGASKGTALNSPSRAAHALTRPKGASVKR